MPPKLLTTGQLAKELGVAAPTVARWAREGLITPALVTAGGHYRWDLDQVKRELTARQDRNQDAEE